MDITAVVAVIGCVTGVFSLGLTVYQLYAAKPRLKVSFDRPELNGFTRNQKSFYKCQRIAVFPVELSNVGGMTLSISSVIVSCGDVFIRHDSSYGKVGINFPIENGFRVILDSGELVQLQLPLRIEPGQLVNTAFVFPFADSLFEKHRRHPGRRVHIAVKTLANTLHFRVPVMDLTPDNVSNYEKNHSRKLHKL